MARLRIGEILLSQGRIDPIQLDAALAYQKRRGGRIGQAIVDLGLLSEQQLLELVGAQIGVPFVVIGDRAIPRAVIDLIPRKFMRARRVIALERAREHSLGPVVVAFADPADLAAVDEIAFATGLDVRPVLAAAQDIDQAVARHLASAGRS